MRSLPQLSRGTTSARRRSHPTCRATRYVYREVKGSQDVKTVIRVSVPLVALHLALLLWDICCPFYPLLLGSSGGGNNEIFTGGAPHPNLALNRPIARPRQSTGRPGPLNMRPPPPLHQAPSLINHLLNKKRTDVEAATQVPFLSHAGCGTLSVTALNQWLSEQGHFSRALCTFLGSVIGKIRLPEVTNPEHDSDWRLLDLLVSALNMRRESWISADPRCSNIISRLSVNHQNQPLKRSSTCSLALRPLLLPCWRL